MRHFWIQFGDRETVRDRGDRGDRGERGERGQGGERSCHSGSRSGSRDGQRHGHERGGRGGHGDDGMFRGRRFSSDDLQLILLAQLKAGQSHGYELIKALADMSGGVYTPSPGMVYPALTYLEEIGFAEVTLVGNKKLYAVSEAGNKHLETSSARLQQLTEMLGFMAKRARAMREGLNEGVEGNSSLKQAHLALREALMATHRAPDANQSRIAEILLRAADDIKALQNDR